MAMTESAAPVVNALNRPFWTGAAEGRLMLPHCVATARAFWPPAPLSPYADGGMAWREARPDGTVIARVVYRRPFQQAFATLLPYGIAMVALDCGVRLQAHVPAPDDPASPVAGDRVRLQFEILLDGGLPLPVARPATD